MELKDIDEVNAYYENLNIKPCWDLDSLTIEELNIIANTFEGLHKIYPEVVIEEIGDLYSYDKVLREGAIISGKKIYETHSYVNHEFFINEPKEKLEEYEKLMKKLVLEMESDEVKVDNEKYCKTGSSATYTEWSRNIKINHNKYLRSCKNFVLWNNIL
ncbi:hypothetical protein [Clostridium estertheticum]|uniref:Uncharacterized protein n=1 Tax=Clostridium estertheticum TaxID=238834 RepID=A0AA47EMB5_9CLOT|nr:hypothetical protein [Clostridium estertheticum]MBU3154766.1 hypothetical protein [Clostridium estertheticum]WAG61656.1 hypothetical protein LL038_05275 [Clostridium estertheticum]